MSARPAPAMAIGSSNNSTNQRQQEAPADTPKSKKKQQMQEQLMMLASNKRSRLELLGAQNDHNYSSVTRAQSGSGSGKQPQQQNENKAGAGCDERQQREEALQADGSSGRMDDCTAAMVLMFLSSRPGEPPQAESQSQLQELPVAVDAALELSSKPKNLFAKSGSLASSNSSRCPNENHNNNNNNNNNNNTRQQQPVQPRGKPELSHDHHYQRHLELELELKLRRLAPLQPTVPGRPAIVLNDREEGAEFGAGELLLAEEEEEDDEQVGSGSATGPKTSGQAKDAKMSKLRNSQPIEMQSADSNNLQGRTRRTSATSGKYLAMLQPLHHHQRQPKRPHGLDCDAMASLKRTSVLGRPVAAAFRGGGGGHRLVLDEDQEEEEEDECELAFVETSPSKVEDEMIFELQQVDQVGEVGQAAASQSAEWANGAQTSRQPEASERDEHELRFTKKRAKVTAGQLEAAAAAAAAANVESSSDKRLRANKLGDVEELAAKKGCEPATGSDRNRACDRPAEAEVGLGAEEHKPSSRKEQLSAEPAEDDEEQAMKELANEHEHEHNPDEEQAHEHELGEASREAFQLAEAELLRFGSMRQQLQAEQLQLQLQQHKHQHQLQPVKMRTIFSCMWPSCSKNCDSLEDIERHVRTHLGSTKQYDSIGDEDFYYEETEVDEPTYLTIFGRESLASSAQRPGVVVGGGPRGCAGSSSQHNSSSRGGKSGGLALSPSHNSDGLSSGHSFASSSPATSPVCSTDSSPPSSASSSSSSSSLSYHHYHRNHQNHLYASAASSVANSIDWNQFLAGSSSMAAFEQQHFLAGTSKGLNGATAKNQHVHLAPISMMPLGNGGGSGSSKTLTATEGNYLMQQQQQQQIYHQQLTTGSAGSPFRFALAGSDQLGQEVFKAKSRRPQATTTTTTTTKHNSNQNLASQQHQHQMSGSLQFSMQLSGGTGGSQPATSPHSPPLHYTGAIYRGAQPEGRFSQQPNGNTTKQKFQAICRANQSQQQRRGRRPKQQQQQEAGNKTAQPRTTTTKTNHQQHQQIFQHNLMNEPQTKCNSNLKPRNLKSTSAPSSTPTPTQQQQQNYQAHTSTTTTSMQNSSAATSTTTTTSYSNSPLPLIRAKVGVGACGDQPPTTTDYEEDDSSSLSAYSSQQQQQQQQRRQLFNQPTPHTLNTAAASKPARRARGENRKCRKVYGMERRDQWCTQCKWKKACTRFGLELAAIGGTVEG